MRKVRPMRFPSGRFLFLLIVGFHAVCQGQAKLHTNGEYVAYSLREAKRCSKGDDPYKAAAVLGGITRIAGMVHDPDSRDLIIIGIATPKLPAIHLDDLVVAMRARLVHDEWPLVSIDPAENTETTGMQVVSFDGHLERTTFGRDFLEADIVLKRYSLGCLKKVQGIPTYKELVEKDIVERAEKGGIRVRKIGLTAGGSETGDVDIHQLHGIGIRQQDAYRARFWFYSMKPYRAVAKDGIFCIKELRIGVRSEVAEGRDGRQADVKNSAYDTLRNQFAENWTEHLPELCAAYPVLKRLKALYDLVALAEAIRETNHHVDLEYFLRFHKVSSVPVVSAFPLINEYELFDRSDGLRQLVRISGGIQLRSEIRWLNYGDVTPLRKIVIDSRPSPDAVVWSLPLKNWDMPNARDLAEASPDKKEGDSAGTSRESRSLGCSVLTQSVILNPALRIDSPGVKPFTGFSLAPSLPPRLRGVSLQMTVSDSSFRSADDKTLDNLLETLLKSKPNPEAACWSASESEEPHEP